MNKYNHTLWQKITIPVLWLYWKLSVIENKKSWHEVKKGIEKHEHKFTKEFWHGRFRFLQCEHEGCYTCHDPEIDKL